MISKKKKKLSSADGTLGCAPCYGRMAGSFSLADIFNTNANLVAWTGLACIPLLLILAKLLTKGYALLLSNNKQIPSMRQLQPLFFGNAYDGKPICDVCDSFEDH
jgi:hypothetical protein